jgi:hypothetical protein
MHNLASEDQKLPTPRERLHIDEYENLAPYQQRIINTWLKHSEPPLIFNLAMKRNGFKTRATEGMEALSDIHDYRDVDIEDFDLDREFPTFAAEILLLRLRLAGVNAAGIDPEVLRDPAELSARRASGYVNQVTSAVRRIFPSVTHRELAAAVFADVSLLNRLGERTAKALAAHRGEGHSVDDFVRPGLPEASIIAPALLSRDSLSADDVKEELDRLEGGRPNKFTGTTDWIHNNFIGCYLQLFDGLVRPCPFYGGMATYCLMSRGNLRHFLELCHQALARSGSGNGGVEAVSVEMQAEAAREVSADLLTEVRSFGPQGNNLHTFLLRLGSLFSLSQRRSSQSEPERTHFSILGGEFQIGEGEVSFLSEAVKWSVLFEVKGTKKKYDSDPEGVEYVLNPIYSPYFHISYRKRRKLDLPPSDATTLISGSYESVRQLLRDYQRRWSVDVAETSLPLFAHLEDDEAR